MGWGRGNGDVDLWTTSDRSSVPRRHQPRCGLEAGLAVRSPAAGTRKCPARPRTMVARMRQCGGDLGDGRRPRCVLVRLGPACAMARLWPLLLALSAHSSWAAFDKKHKGKYISDRTSFVSRQENISRSCLLIALRTEHTIYRTCRKYVCVNNVDDM